MRQAALGAATQGFIGAPLDRAALQHIADALAALYAMSDVALYQVGVPEQDFAGGDVRIAVQEGYVERVETQGDAALGLAGAYGERLAAERPLRKSSLQRYVSLLRDMPGVAVTPTLRRGSAPGGALLSLDVARRALPATVAFDSGLGLQAVADFTALAQDGGVSRMTVLLPLQSGRATYAALSQTLPLDADGTAISLGTAWFHAPDNRYGIRNDGLTTQIALSHAFVRDAGESLTGSLGFDAADMSSAIGGRPWSGAHLRSFRLGAAYSASAPDQGFALSATASLGAAGQGGASLSADPVFAKLLVQMQFDRRLADGFLLRLRGVAQIAANRLAVQELYLFGGTGSAFAPATTFGDSAAGGRAELDADLRTGWQPYVFLDGAAAWLRARPFFSAQVLTLASAGAGLRLALDATTAFEIEGAAGLSAPAPNAGAWRLFFALSRKTD